MEAKSKTVLEEYRERELAQFDEVLAEWKSKARLAARLQNTESARYQEAIAKLYEGGEPWKKPEEELFVKAKAWAQTADETLEKEFAEIERDAISRRLGFLNSQAQ